MGIVRIDFERCKECGYCINFCPKNVLAKGAAVNKRGYFPPVEMAASHAGPVPECARMLLSRYIRKIR